MKSTIGAGQGLRLLSALLITGLHTTYAKKAPRSEDPSYGASFVSLSFS